MQMIIASFIEEDLKNLDSDSAKIISNNLSVYLKSLAND